MTAPASRWKLGLFVVGGATAGLVGLGFLGARELRRQSHLAYAYFDEALTGLEEGSPVKFRGVTVGVVDRIRVASDKKHLEVQAALYDDYLRDLGLDAEQMEVSNPMLQRLRAQVVMSWVTSTAFVQVDYFPDPPRGPQELPFAVPTDAPTLRTVPSTAKSLEAAAREVLRELPAVAGAARELVGLLRSELEAARLPELSRRLQAVLAQVQAQLDAVEQSGTVTAATGALHEVADTARALREQQQALGDLVGEWTGLARDARAQLAALELADASQQVQSAASSVRANAASLQADVARELVQLRRTLQAVERLARMLERDPSSLLRGRPSAAGAGPGGQR